MRKQIANWNNILEVLLAMRFAILLTLGPLIAHEALAQDLAKLYSIEGTVEGRISPSTDWHTLAPNAVFRAGDAIKTGDGSRAAILGSDGMMVRLSANALLEFKQPKEKPAEISIAAGAAHFLSRDPHASTRITTSIVSGSIRGTEFSVAVRPDLVTFSVLNGAVDCSNEFGAVSLAGGEEGVTEPGKAPQKRIMLRPFDAVQWTMKYPALVSISGYLPWIQNGNPSEQQAASLISEGKYLEARKVVSNDSSRAAFTRALADIASGNLGSAKKELGNSKGSADAGVLLLKSALALESGEVEVAKQFQEEAESLLASNSSAGTAALMSVLKSQQSIIYLVQNDRSLAQEKVDYVLERDPKNVGALFSKSTLEQGKGNLEEALKSINLSLEIEPNNPSLLARSSELNFGSGNLEQAEELAKKALAINPSDSDARTVLGFIYLSRGQVEEGRRAFENSISDGNSSYAHLGLGIALFRSGQREEGRVEIQKAVHLDPQVSLYRSYLGKAFFENEQEELASEELSTASRLDPLDPTPHLYTAFNELALFRPISALSSLEEAIALNDNRAVYRSRLLLDQDQATRGTGLGRIFGALDFTQPARIEALKSLSEDPTSYEAHFLLKDSLVGADTNSAAISEDVVATLLAPATFSSLIPTASGSATLNEYTSLFERPQGRTGVDIIGQSKDRLFESSEVHFAGGDDYSYLLRHGMTYANGYRDNDYDRAQTGRLLAQKDISTNDKLLVEGIVTDRSLGDNQIGLDPETNDPDQSFDFEDYTSRLGYRHTFSQQSQLISQVIFINSNSTSEDLSQQRPFILEIEQDGELQQFSDSGIFDANSSYRTKGTRGDIQHLLNSEYWSLVSGASVLGFKDYQYAEANASADELDLFDSVDLNSQAENNVHAYRGYSYSTFKPMRELRLIAGLNYSNLATSARQSDAFVDRESRQTEFSPKAGIIVYPNSSTTLRTAYFETLGQTSSRDLEGVEQTQVAGVQQLFDEPVGTKARVLDFGADWKLPKSTYAGFNLMTRSLSSPQSLSSDVLVVDSDFNLNGVTREDRFDAHSQEYSASTYINQILTDRITSTLNYEYIDSDEDFYEYQIKTHKVRLGVNYFDPSGVFVFGSGTWRSQDRENFDSLNSSVDTDFTILSAGLGWQLPHRHGSVQLAVRNFLDEDFNYQPVASDVRFYSGVDVSLGVSLNF